MHYVASEISNAAIYSFLEGLKLNLDIMQVYLVLCTCRDSDCFQESPKPCLYSKWLNNSFELTEIGILGLFYIPFQD